MGPKTATRNFNPCRLCPFKHSKQVPSEYESGALMLDLLLVILIIIIIIILIIISIIYFLVNTFQNSRNRYCSFNIVIRLTAEKLRNLVHIPS